MKFWKLMVLGRKSSYLSAFFPLLPSCTQFYSPISPARLLCKVQLHAVRKPVSQFLVEPVPALQKADWCQKSPSLSVGWALLLWNFFPLPFCFCYWLCVFSPMTHFQLESPSLATCFFTLSCSKHNRVFQCGWFDMCAVAYQYRPVASTAHEAQHAEQCLS